MVLGLEAIEVGSSFFIRHTTVGLNHLREGFVHGGGHVLGVTTYVDEGTL